MQAARFALLALALVGPFAAHARATDAGPNPLSKTIELIDQLIAKINAEGEAELKAYKDYVEWCDDMARNGRHTVEDLKKKIAKANAKKEKGQACVEECEDKKEEITVDINALTEELDNATLVRNKEKEEFDAAEKELLDAIDILERAIAILEREMAKNPALLQGPAPANLKALVQSLSVVIDAASFSQHDKATLVGFIQQQDTEDDAEEQTEAQLGAPDPAAYKSHSKGIVEILEDMLEKAKADLAALRKAEGTAAHNYAMLKQAIEEEMRPPRYAEFDKTEEKRQDCIIDVSTNEAELDKLNKLLADAEAGLNTAQTSCMQVAADHEATLLGRAEELKALHTAKKILQSTTSGAEAQTYSLLQIRGRLTIKSRADLAGAEVVSLVKRLAQREHSAALAQLASKITVALQYGAAGGEDPFAKIKGLIGEMIDRLMKEAAEEASEKAYCDEQMSKTEAKKSELEDEIAKLTAKLDKAASDSAILKDDVKQLQKDLAALMEEQTNMDKIRKEENAAYLEAKADLEQGLGGVQKALDVLRTYYGGAFLQDASASDSFVQQPPLPEKHSKSSGAGGGIIDILTVVETDMSAELAKTESEEADAAADYEKTTQANTIERTTMEQDVKYKTQTFTGLDKEIAELTNDKDTANTELSAVLEYYEQIKGRCIAKPETFESRKERRDAEIAGLKQALSILEGQALLQRGSRGALLRR